LEGEGSTVGSTVAAEPGTVELEGMEAEIAEEGDIKGGVAGETRAMSVFPEGGSSEGES